MVSEQLLIISRDYEIGQSYMRLVLKFRSLVKLPTNYLYPISERNMSEVIGLLHIYVFKSQFTTSVTILNILFLV